MAAIVFGAIALVLIGLGIASVSVRRHGESDRPDPSWRPSDELFNDPTTHRLMRVWIDPTGGRHYLLEGESRAN